MLGLSSEEFPKIIFQEPLPVRLDTGFSNLHFMNIYNQSW